MILTPHIAGSTAEAQEAVGVQIAMQVREYLKHGVVQNAVNLPSLSHEEYQQVAPYLEMAQRLGVFLGHSLQGEYREHPSDLQRTACGDKDGPGAQRRDPGCAGALRGGEPHQCGVDRK